LTKFKKFKKKKFIVYDSIFNRKIFVLINYPTEELRRFYKKIGCEGSVDGDGLMGYAVELRREKDGMREYIIWVKDFEWTLQDQNTLIHEITHTIFKIWEFNNIPFCKETQEFMAHSIGNLYELVGRKLLR
jgi:hypothetical protein